MMKGARAAEALMFGYGFVDLRMAREMPPDELVDLVARAICREAGEMPDWLRKSSITPWLEGKPNFIAYRAAARAVIALVDVYRQGIDPNLPNWTACDRAGQPAGDGEIVEDDK